MHKVLVLDANQRSALAAIRSLGRRGLKVIAGDHVPGAIGAASKYAADSVHYPNPAESASAFLDEVRSIISRIEADVVVPATDLTTMLLVGQADLPNGARAACPNGASYEALSDKARLLEIARQLKVPAPETLVAHNPQELQAAAREFGYPVVLKPARSRYLHADKVFSTSVSTINTAKDLSKVLAQLGWLEHIPCLVQRFVPGHGAGIFTLHDASGPLAWFAHRRLREKPPTGGVSVLSESVRPDNTLQSASQRLLSAVHWVGLAMVEFRIGSCGTPYLMEVNGRLWGSLQLAIDSGVDFPWLLFQVTRGLPVEPPFPYVVGRRLRWLLGDLDSLILEVRKNQLSLPRKAQATGAFLRSFVDSKCRQEVFRLSDPGPGLREIGHWTRSAVRALAD